eukprot:9283322-Karenia_brevis.AAC.1
MWRVSRKGIGSAHHACARVGPVCRLACRVGAGVGVCRAPSSPRACAFLSARRRRNPCAALAL